MGTAFTSTGTVAAAAASRSIYQFSDIYTDVGEERYATRSLSADQKTEAKRLTNLGYMELVAEADWVCLHPSATIDLWGTVTGTMTVTGSGLIITDSTNSPFLATMVGHTIVSTNGSYVIDAFTSTSVVTVTSTAAADTGEAFTITNSGNYTMPATFAYMDTEPIFNAADTGLGNIRQATAAEILSLRAGSSGGTYAALWAVTPHAFTAATGQLWDLIFWPTPTSSDTVTIQYRINPAAMSLDTEYPVGGNAFNLAVRAYALRAAERTKQQNNGVREAQAKAALQAALIEDHRERARGPIAITAGETRRVPMTRRDSHLGVSIS
jgi:hypothetical protein